MSLRKIISIREGMMPDNILEARELRKQYENVEAVRGINFDIQSGEIFSLLGPNGAGKTTTISMLSCLVEPTKGDATISGHSILKESNAVKKEIGVVPQEIALYPTLTARENLAFWGKMYGLGGSVLKERISEVLEVAGLAKRADQKVETYSGGMKRRINIAVGLLHQPKLLYMDEPTVGIDPQSRRRILDTVMELNKSGLTVLYTTHYMEEAEELSDRIGIIDNGEIIAIGSQQELTRSMGEFETINIRLAEDNLDGSKLTAALNKIKGVDSSSYTDSQLNVQAQDSDAAIGKVIDVINKHKGRILEIKIAEPNLEAVFLHLTGRALRDD
jgi:ABC-2 type transport system ATP-binding protein